MKLDDKNSIGNLNGIQQEYSTEYNISSHGNNHYDNTDKEIYSAQRHVIYDRSNAEKSPVITTNH